MALGSGIRKLPLPDPGFKKGTGSGFATLVKSNVFFFNVSGYV